MRLFVALDLSPQLFERVVAYQAQMKQLLPHEKWVRPETLHITLKFIGETKETDAIQRELANIHLPPFEVAIKGVGFFTPEHPRVFYAGIDGGRELPHLAECVDLACSQHGIARNKDPYKPHLTLARSGSGKPAGTPRDRKTHQMSALRDLVAPLPPPDFGTMTATEFFLYESRLSSAGAQYIKLARYQLK